MGVHPTNIDNNRFWYTPISLHIFPIFPSVHLQGSVKGLWEFAQGAQWRSWRDRGGRGRRGGCHGDRRLRGSWGEGAWRLWRCSAFLGVFNGLVDQKGKIFTGNQPDFPMIMGCSCNFSLKLINWSFLSVFKKKNGIRNHPFYTLGFSTIDIYRL